MKFAGFGKRRSRTLSRMSLRFPQRLEKTKTGSMKRQRLNRPEFAGDHQLK
jgi:hypothetical protein